LLRIVFRDAIAFLAIVSLLRMVFRDAIAFLAIVSLLHFLLLYLSENPVFIHFFWVSPGFTFSAKSFSEKNFWLKAYSHSTP
ncbi:MAG: hypothetical protein DRR19_32685, partial [Candidatus Parabeggiatoa sp. nov. 1]